MPPSDDFPAFRVGGYEVAESEFPADVLAQFVGESLGGLEYESGSETLRSPPHALLRGLHQKRHCRVLPAHEAAEVHSGINLLAVGTVAPVENEADVGDDSEEVASVSAVEFHGFVVAGREQNLRPRALALNLLLLVEGVAYGLAVLLEDELVEQRKIGGVVAH